MNFETVKKTRTAAKGTITRVCNWITKNKDVRTDVTCFETQLEMLNAVYQKYCSAQDEIENCLIELHDIEDNENRDTIDEQFFEACVILKNKIKQFSTNFLNTSMSPGATAPIPLQQSFPKVEVKLPQINIQPFKGSSTEWASFLQIFDALIIKNDLLSDVQRFIYLKSFLRDEPLKLIDSLNVTNENFNTALDILKSRYENKISVVNSHLVSLLEIPSLTKCNASTLREFLTNCKRNLNSLYNLKYSSQKLFEFLMIYLLNKKLSYEIRKAFELERDIDELPELDDFFDFLEKRCIVLENLSSTDTQDKKPSKPNTRVSLHTNSNLKQNTPTNNCFYCKNSSHKIYTCYSFKHLSLQEKRNFVNSNKLCYNCLGTDKHTSADCTSQTCSLCSKKHHTLLHNPNPSNQFLGASSTNVSTNQQSSPRGTPSNDRQNPDNRGNPRSSHGQSSSYQRQSSNAQARGNYAGNNQSNPPRNQNSGNSQNPSSLNAPNSSNSRQQSHALSAFSSRNSQVLLSTACVTIYDNRNNPIRVKAILDNGSQNSFITEKLVKKLNYVPYCKTTHVSGIALSNKISSNMVDVTIHSNANSYKRFKLSCAVLPVITSNLPHFSLNTDTWNIPNDLCLADSSFTIPSEIDLLIGSDLYYNLLTRGMIHLGRNLPTLLNTHLGWIIGGTFPNCSLKRNNSNSNWRDRTHASNSYFSCESSTQQSVSLFVQNDESSLESIVAKFWSMEEISQKKSLSLEDERAETIFHETTKILENGKFQVDIPLKNPNENAKLDDSFSIARKRFLNLEKFQKNPEYYNEYKKFINEYVSLGHAKYVPLSLTNELSNPKYFLPHHAVLKQDSVTTKLRVVFDASCKSSSGYSLNDIALKGFQVQPDLYDILCRFRSFKYVLTTDIEKMYRQIEINPNHRFLLNILWRENPTEKLKCIELSTVTYGTNSAPYLATRVVNEIATTNFSEFPLASSALLNQTYIDDILGGVDDYNDLEVLYNELNKLLNSHGFPLHKWCSNSQKMLEKISQPKIPECDMNFEDSPNKVLGLKWNPITDFFAISIPEYSFSEPVTKRKILSTIAQCYDPLGFLSPIIITGKLIIHQLWLLKVDWDVPISDEVLLSEWTNLIENLPLLKNLKIPRYLFLNKEIKDIQFHGFADASLKAFSACVYVRAVYYDQTVSSFLISSKSRVAPLKVVTLPRLELCAMLLLSQLVTKLLSVFENRFTVNSVHLWSDSQIALSWIQSHSSRWNIFVSNRVAQIQNLTSNFSWHYVKSADNPADLPSRGIPIDTILTSEIWWNGPKFLKDPNVNFSENSNPLFLTELPEERKVSLVTSNLSEQTSFWSPIFQNFSSFSKLQRTVAYILRFINNSKPNVSKNIGVLEVHELKCATNLILKNLQTETFSKEISELKNSNFVSDKNIQKLNPFLDTEGLLRVGGRLENADIPFEQKHPILLPSKNYTVHLMLLQEHKRLGHVGAQTVLSNFRLKYWPLNGLREIKKLIRNCTTCFRFEAQPSAQIMADLPQDRVTISRPFSRVGVDFGGPFLLKSSKLRKAPVFKCYMAIFVCMITKAVHIELVTSLSTEDFILSLKRFISRRGNPNTIFCDNGTNFVGAKNQLYELYTFFQNKENSDSIKEFMSVNQIEFKFIPPKSPHWGGIWEAAVKSAKYHIRRLIGETQLTFEEFYTILVQIEAILNSRPLCPLSNDPNDFQVLTPGHFLIGTSLTAHPEKDIFEIPENRLNLWKRISKVQQSFWKKWKVDYLNRLQNRPKWFKTSPNLTVDSLVILKDDDSPPLKWPLARVLEVIPGKDNQIRVVKLKTQDGIFTRTITKVCPLPQQEIPESYND
jgi:hypothetical protein